MPLEPPDFDLPPVDLPPGPGPQLPLSELEPGDEVAGLPAALPDLP